MSDETISSVSAQVNYLIYVLINIIDTDTKQILDINKEEATKKIIVTISHGIYEFSIFTNIYIIRILKIS